MKFMTQLEIVSLYDALRALEKAQAALYAAHEKLLGGRVGSLKSEIQMELNKWTVVNSFEYQGGQKNTTEQ